MKKLKLNELNVQSFVTAIENSEQLKLKGEGTLDTHNPSGCIDCIPRTEGFCLTLQDCIQA